MQLSVHTTISLASNMIQDLTLDTAFVNTTVTDSAANPVSGATVEMALSQSECNNATSFDLFPGAPATAWYGSATAITDASGDAALPVLPCQDPLSIEVVPPSGSGLAGTTIGGVTVTGDTSLAVTLPAAVSFSGVLLDSEGNPIAGTAAGPAIQLNDSSGGSFVSHVAADGSFSFQVGAGTYTLFVESAWSPTATSTVQLSVHTTISLASNTIQDLTLDTAFVNTTVTDSAANPVSGATVEMALSQSECNNATSFDLFPGAPATAWYGSATAITDASGDAALPVLPCQDPLSIEVVPPSGSGLAGTTIGGVTVTGDTSLAVTLPAAVSFSGVLLDSEGNPIAGTAAGPAIQLNDSSGGSFVSHVAADGSFSFQAGAGTYTLFVESAWSPTATSTVQLSVHTTISLASNTIQDLTLDTAFVNTTVTDSAANPVSGATVEMALSQSECNNATSFDLFPGAPATAWYGSATAITDASGDAALPVLPCQDPLSIEVVPPSGSGLAGTAVGGVTVTGDTPLAVTLYSISGDLTGSAASPLVGQIVTLTQTSSSGTPSATRRPRTTAATGVLNHYRCSGILWSDRATRHVHAGTIWHLREWCCSALELQRFGAGN